MTVSVGFYKKIIKWVLDEGTDNVVFRPFLTNGNPYKSRVLLVGQSANPVLKVEQGSESVFVEALVNEDLLDDLYRAELLAASREYKGSVQFLKWYEKMYGENVILTSLNTYQTDSVKELKALQRQDEVNYNKGVKIFKEVIEEFEPEIIILQGAATVEQFKVLYSVNLILLNSTVTKIQELEELGPFAEMFYENGKVVKVFATRSMAYFGKSGESFGMFKEKLEETLKNIQNTNVPTL